MATVRFSDELKGNIKDAAKKIHDPSIDKARHSIPEGFGRKIYDAVFDADTQAKMAQLPARFFKTHDTLHFEGFFDTNTRSVRLDFGQPEDHHRSYTTPSLDVSGLPWAYDTNKANDGCDLTYGRGVTLAYNQHKFADILEEYTAWGKRVQTAEAKRDAFVAGVGKIIDNYSTLAPALKAWPALWDLIPEDKKTKHKEVVERRSNKPVELDMDTSSLTASVTLAKLVR